MAATFYAASSAVVGVFLIWRYIRFPRNMPQDIPRIPLYATILAIWYDMSSIDYYNRWLREPLEKHGAVTVWFADRWNVLVAQPDLLTDLLRHEDLYIKTGLSIKNSYAAIGRLVGENIINAHHNRKLHMSVMKPGLVKSFDMGPIQKKSRRFVQRLIQAQIAAPDRGLSVREWLEKLTMDVMLLNFFGVDLEVLNNPDVQIRQIVSKLKQKLFSPLILTFPILDRIWWALPARRRTFQALEQFDDMLYNMVQETDIENSDYRRTVVSHFLKQARESNKMNDWQFRSNVRMIFMVGYETIQSILISAMWELGNNAMAQDRLRAEICDNTSTEITSDALNNLPYLLSTVYELLRLYPPVVDFFNRAAVRPAMLGGRIPIDTGTFVGWNAYGVHTNPDVWGPTAREYHPERWGQTVAGIQSKVRLENLQGNYIPFNAHARKCLGQSFAMLEIRIALIELVKQLKWTIDPTYQLKMTGLGPLTFPLGLRVIVEELNQEDDP